MGKSCWTNYADLAMPAANTLGWDDEQIDEFKQAFYSFDEDGEGTIGREELGQLLEALGENLTPPEVDEMMAEVDEDGSGQIDFDEFLGMMQKKMSDDELKHVVTDFCGKLTDAEVNELLSEADISGDGLLAYEEFYKIMMFDKVVVEQ